MTAKQYLSQALRLRRLIRQTEEQIANIKLMATSTGAIRYDKDNVQSSPTNDAMTDYVVRLEAAEERARKLVMDYLETYMMIDNQIRQIMPGIYADVLYLRYIKGMTLEQIGEDLNYSEGYIRNVHGRALQAFQKKFM